MNQETIVRTATQMAVQAGFNKITRQAIAERLGIFPSSVSFHCGRMSDLRAQIVQYAVDHALDGGRFHYIDVVAQALAAKHPVALRAPKEVKAAAAEILAA